MCASDLCRKGGRNLQFNPVGRARIFANLLLGWVLPAAGTVLGVLTSASTGEVEISTSGRIGGGVSNA